MTEKERGCAEGLHSSKAVVLDYRREGKLDAQMQCDRCGTTFYVYGLYPKNVQSVDGIEVDDSGINSVQISTTFTCDGDVESGEE